MSRHRRQRNISLQGSRFPTVEEEVPSQLTHREMQAGENKQGERCKHHWEIEEPKGPTSKGVCKLCGATREFYNFLPGEAWSWKERLMRENQKNILSEMNLN